MDYDILNTLDDYDSDTDESDTNVDHVFIDTDSDSDDRSRENIFPEILYPEDVDRENLIEPEQIEIEMPIDELISGISMEREDIGTWRNKPKRAGRGYPVLPNQIKANVVGPNIHQLSTVSDKPDCLYNLMYGNTKLMIVTATNLAIAAFNSDSPTTAILPVTEQELRSYFGIRLIIMLKKGRHCNLRMFYRNHLLKKSYNMFLVIGKEMNNLIIPTFARFQEIIKFMHQGGEKTRIEKKKFIKSLVKIHSPDGGYFETVYRRKKTFDDL